MESLEGATYSSEIALQGKVDIEKIPDAASRGDFKPPKLESSAPTFIVLDLETTDLIRNGRMPHITQIAAQEVDSGCEFCRYIMPKEPVSKGATQITGIFVTDGKMIVKGAEVDKCSLNHAIEDFVQWLKKFNNVLLVAHNGSKFDFPVLLSAVSRINMLDDLMANVAGCLDSLTLFRKAFGNRGGYKQEDLARDILSIQYNAHDAVEDVSTLVKLFKHSLTLVPDVLKFSCSIKAVQASSSSSEYS